MSRIIAIWFVVFGVAHFILALAELDTLIGQPVGPALAAISLAAGLAFAFAGVVLFSNSRGWRPATLAGTLLSLTLVTGASSIFDAFAVIDVVILVGLARVWISDWDNGHTEERPARSGRLS